MNKKFFLIIAFLCATFAGLSAQKMSGRWSLYPTVGRTIDKAINTGDKVFFLTGNDLYHYSEGDKETFSYSTSGSLTGANVLNFYYNPDSRQILVVFADSNLDIIDADGTITNVSAIRDASLMTTKGIRDVAFKDNKAYMATDFGLVVIDMKKGLVDKSAIWGFGPDIIGVAGDNIVINFLTARPDKNITAGTNYVASTSAKLSSFDAFKLSLVSAYKMFEELDDTHLIGLSSDGYRTRLLTVSPEGEMQEVNKITNYVPQIFRGADNRIYAVEQVSTGYNLRALDPSTLAFDAGEAIGSDLALGSITAGKTGYNSIWVGSSNGLGKYDLTGSSVLMAPYFPQGSTVRYPHLMRWDSKGRLWVSNQGGGTHYTNVGSDLDGVRQEKFVSIIDGNHIFDNTPRTLATVARQCVYWYRFDDVTPEDEARFARELDPHMYIHLEKERMKETPYIIGGPNHVLPDPDDPDLFWVATATDGIYLCKINRENPFNPQTNPQGDVLNIYSAANFPYQRLGSQDGYSRIYNLQIDPEGNLWVAFRHLRSENYGTDHPFNILPASVRKTRPTKAKYNDWIVHPGTPQEQLHVNVSMEFSKKSTMLFAASALYGSGLHCIDTKGTYLDPSDDDYRVVSNIYDQDNNSINPLYYTAIKEDKTGQVWVTFTEGLFVIPDANDAKSETLRVKRPIVPRNDGTNYGDYLLDGVSISAMDVDPTNRKWFATFDNGLYLVNADGSKILEHFTTDNSPLPSNVIYNVSCDPNSNKVYIGTDMGILCYESDASPAEEDFSNVYVYPNPVRPEFNGWITIAGLMDNSLVKIADINGTIVFQGNSSGGTLMWDGCNSAGERVRTGVYLVLASSSDDSGASNAVVSKIMIMN